jgi:tripartite ATP-independent transporter DctM subunit
MEDLAVIHERDISMLSLRKSHAVFDSAANLLDKAVLPISRLSVWISSGLLLIMSFLTVADVSSRWMFKKPLSGTIELEGYMLALFIFLGTAYTGQKDKHITVDIISRKYPKKISLFISSFSSAAFMLFAAMISFYQFEKCIEAFRMDEVGQITGIPLYPFMLITALGAALLFAVFLVKYLRTQAEILREFKRPWFSILLVTLTVGAFILSPEILKEMFALIHPMAIGIICTFLMMICLFAGVPIAAAIGFCGIAGIWYLQGFDSAGAILKMTVFTSVSEYLFTVLPLFIGMGFLAFAAGLSENLYQCFYRVFGGLRGSLAMATVGGSAGFAAICGDSMATAATMGSVALPEMKKLKYDDALASGCLAAGGTLGILIPPSIGFIIYGMITEQSVGKLFMAGVLPGFILAMLFCGVIYVKCMLNPSAGPAGPSANVAQRIKALWDIWPILLISFVVIGGLYAGIFTPTEAGAVGLIAAIFLGLILGRFTWKSFFEALLSTAEISAMIFTVLIGVNVFNYFIAFTDVSQAMTGFVVGLHVSPYLTLTAILIMYAILGSIMAIIPMMMITIPMILPIIIDLGFDPIWFGVLMVIMMEMGLITPPIGINVFIIAGVAKDIEMSTVFRGITVFVLAMALLIVILMIFPDIALVLPNSMKTLAAIE